MVGWLAGWLVELMAAQLVAQFLVDRMAVLVVVWTVDSSLVTSKATLMVAHVLAARKVDSMVGWRVYM
jgi:hypothetical protein